MKKCYAAQRRIIDSLPTHFSKGASARNFLTALGCSSGREGLTLIKITPNLSVGGKRFWLLKWRSLVIKIWNSSLARRYMLPLTLPDKFRSLTCLTEYPLSFKKLYRVYGIHSSNNIFININFQLRAVSQEEKRTAAWIAARDRTGYSFCILRKEYPPLNISRITYMGMRVPLTTGIPSIIWEFISMYLENSSTLRMIRRYSELMGDFNCIDIAYPFLSDKKDNINSIACQENQKCALYQDFKKIPLPLNSYTVKPGFICSKKFLKRPICLDEELPC